MAKLKPWYKVVTPREDLREGKPLDASEFAVHLDKVCHGTAPPDYRDPERFFDRTYLTETLCNLGGEVVRRLSGETTETSAVFKGIKMRQISKDSKICWIVLEKRY